MHCVLIQ